MKQMQITLAEDTPGIGLAGQRVNLALTPSDVHDPTEISSYLAGYSTPLYRADEASQVILVDNDEDKYRTFSDDDAFLPVNVKSGGVSGGVPEVDPKSSLAGYKVIDRFVGSFVPWQSEAQKGNSYQPRMAAARRCARAINLDRELDVFGPAGILGAITAWDTTVRTALGATYQWNGGSASDPIADLQLAMEKSAQPITAFWMSQKTANAFIRHEKVRSHMRQLLGDQPATLIAQGLASAGNTSRPIDFVIPGIAPIKVVGGKYKNASGALVAICADGAVIGTVNPDGTPTDGEEIATSYTFRRRGPSSTGFESREFEVPGRGPLGGTMIVVSCADVAKMTGSNCGAYITGAIQ